MATGTYVEASPQINITPATTPASRVTLHGGSATLKSENAEPFIVVERPTTIRDLRIESLLAPAIRSSGPLSIERVQLRAGTGVQLSGLVNAIDVLVEPAFTGPSS